MSLVTGKTPNLGLNLINYDQIGWNTPEYENLYILDAAIRQFTSFTGVKGIWKNATDYVDGDAYIDTSDSSIWRATEDHTSPSTGTFGSFRSSNPGVWTLVSGGVDDIATQDSVAPEAYNAVGDGITDDSDAVENAILEALASGKTFVGNKIYRVSRLIQITFTSTGILKMSGNGGFVFTGATSGIRIDVPFKAVKIINAVDNNASFTWNTGFPTLISTPCARVDLGASHGVGERELVKIISNDQLTQTNLIRYQGETQLVGAVSGQYIYLTGHLRNTYNTSPRAVVYDSSKKIIIDGLSFSSDWDTNVSTNAQRNYLYIAGAVAPMLSNLNFYNTTLSGLVTDACIHPFTTNLRFHNGRNAISSASGTSGYGHIDRNCEYGVFINTQGVNMRHTYTAFGVSVDVNNPLRYGSPYGSVLVGGSDLGSSGAGFDLHSETENISFLGLSTANSYYGEESSGSGIQVRGGRHHIQGCRHSGSGVGLKLGKENPGEYGDHYITDYRYDGDNKAIRAFVESGVGGSTLKMSLDGINVTTTLSPAIDVQSMDVSMRHVRIKQKSQTSNPVMIAIGGTNTILRLHGMENIYDWRGAATGGCIVEYSGTGHTISVYGEVISTGTTWASAIRGSSAQTATLLAKVNADVAPTINALGIDNVGSSTVRSYVVVGDGVGGDSGLESTSLSTGSNTLSMGAQWAPTVVKSLVCPTSGIEVNNIAAGTKYGQILILLNDHTSTNDFVLKQSHANRIDIPADITVSPDSGTALIWTGLQWKVFSVAVSVSGQTQISDHGALSGLGDDDHTQYHTDARALTFINTLNLAELADVPTRGTALQILRVNAAGTLLEYVNQYSAKMANFESWLDQYWFYSVVSTQPQLLMKDASAVVKWALTNTHMVVGGDLTERVSNEVLTVKGDIQLKSGGIKGGSSIGLYTDFGKFVNTRIWEDASGLIRAKIGSDPSSASDGRPICGLGILTGTATYDTPSLTDGAGTTTTVSVTGAAVGDFVLTPAMDLTLAGLMISATVTSADTVTVSIFNKTGGTLNIASTTLRVAVVPKAFVGF